MEVMRYRPDIDGLRAFAVMAVVLFHAGLSAVPGGFVGVDIFFVISGYLITRLIVEKLREDKFSFWDFYARRTRRIYPALFVLIPIVLLAGYFVLTPGEYEDLAMSAIYSAAFLPNVYFWLNTGYFDLAAMTMPLLHLWSIGVEEQFYLMWPATLVLVWRFVPLSRQATLIALIVVTALLVLLCVVWTHYDAKAAFYLPFTRLWEFTLGALVLALPEMKRPRVADGLSVAGLTAMLVAVLTFNEGLAYPGYYALLPCLGATAMIAAGENSLIGRVLSFPPNVLLGKLSYSLYLWHWPIFVFYTFYAGNEATTKAKLALVPVAIGLAYLSWRFVETPTRHRRDHPRRHVMYGLATATATACLAFIIVANTGFPGRIPREVRVLGNRQDMLALDCREMVKLVGDKQKRCIVGAPWATASKHAVIWGDSHAKHLVPILDRPARERNLAVALWSGCPPFIDNESLQREKRNAPAYSENCARSRREVLNWLRKTKDVDLVIISNAWAIYPEALFAGAAIDRWRPEEAMRRIEENLRSTIETIDPNRLSVLFVGDVPRPGFNVPDCALQSAAGLWREPCKKFREFFTVEERPIEKVLAKLADGTDRVYFLDTQKAMCADPKGCPIRIQDEIIYRDPNHLRQDLNEATRAELAAKIGLGDALRAALDHTPEAERVEAPGSGDTIPR
jgi:peptidoglycan/LPS O-acetylase OafA/YrhL